MSNSEFDLRQSRRRKAALSDPSTPDRLPPHSIEAEQGVLGCILLSPNDCIGHCILKFTSGPEVFYDLRHRAAYEVLLDMHGRNAAIDLITVQQELKDRNQLESVGGLAYLASLPDTVPSAANLDYYVEIVREKHVLREMITACTDVVSRAYDHQGEVDTLLDEVERDILRISGNRVKILEAKPARDVLSQCVDRYERMVLGEESGINTGFVAIDANGGLFPGEMVLLCGPTGKGKSTLALNIIHATLTARIPTSIFSFEMSAGAWMDRLLALDLSIDRRAFRSRSRFNDGVLLRIAANTARIAAMPLWVCDDTQSTVDDLRRVIKQLVSRNGLKVVVVDYAQIVPPPKAVDSREQQVAYIGRSLRAIAQETNTVMIVLSQLNDEGKVRESRALLHECHLCMTLQDRDGRLWINCTKGRDMQFPDFPVNFDPLFCRITQASQI